MRGVQEDIGSGSAAAVRLARGVPLREALDRGVPAAWTALDVGARPSHRGAYYLPEWERYGAGRTLTTALHAGRPLSESHLALALCHRDGRIRAAALWRLGGHPDLLPLLVVRCADWAEPVREQARLLLGEVLDAVRAVALLPLILRVGHRGRGAFAVGLAGRLLREAPPEVLTALYTDSDRAVRRYAYRLAVEEGRFSAGELARVAAREDDVVVQNLCADAALVAMPDAEPDDVLRPLLAARNPRVRAAGVTALRRAGRPEQATEFLADRAELVRACARYVVRQHGGDPLPWYRERCAQRSGPAGPAGSAPAPGAVAGLAECGERGDAEVLWSLVRHPAAGVRARAVAGLRVLDVADARRLSPMLDDPAPGVVREATAAVLPSAELLPGEWLVERLGAGRPRHVRIAAFRLLWSGAARRSSVP
ncbi:hypothetical protein J2X68_000102 [Streptomyces sp. 3330]|uniref:hypothetical protein n=1 Tax=Streptomyces sp. 3330 TaxID=2817755 RepID=UPI002859155C|nr:hypothetical protein [Streptomyces sp. 3330]MDR6973433.1 hypothetical protein [Streptomyces sp. 3330]